jgi:hypothetical protein
MRSGASFQQIETWPEHSLESDAYKEGGGAYKEGGGGYTEGRGGFTEGGGDEEENSNDSEKLDQIGVVVVGKSGKLRVNTVTGGKAAEQEEQDGNDAAGKVASALFSGPPSKSKSPKSPLTPLEHTKVMV